MKRKAQFKIQETAFVLLAVVLLFGLIFTFFARFEFTRVKELARQTREERAITLVRSIASMPELKCSESFTKVSEAACLDLDKVRAFNENPSLRQRYKKIWSSSYISEVVVQEIFPSNKVYYIYKEQESQESYFSFFPLCSQNNCTLAKLSVGIKLE